MGLDRSQTADGVTTTSSYLPTLKNYLSAYNITETAGSTAVVKIRDSIELATAPSAVDGAAGNVTVGLHMIALTWVTVHGESNLGALVEFTAAGSKHATVTIPVAPVNASGYHSGIDSTIAGRRIYVTKAGAPATGVNPTNAQWFLIAADQSTTVAAGMNNMYMPLTNGSLTVASTTGFAATNSRILVTTANGKQAVSYTSVDATHFLGCTGGQGLLATGNAVIQPMVGDNSSTTFDWNVADGSLPNTRPPTVDTAGKRVARVNLAANETGDTLFANPLSCNNGGGFYVEVTSGTVDWTLRGQ